MYIDIKSYLRNAIELLKISKLPLLILLVSIIIFMLNRYYVESTNIKTVLEQFSLALFSGAIFYFLTNTVSTYQKKKIAKRFAIDRYCSIKNEMVDHLLTANKKTKIDHRRLQKEITNYEVVREYVTDEDVTNIANNLDKILVKEVLHSFRQLKEILAFLSTYDFIKTNDLLYKRIYFLNLWINDFHHYFDLWYADNDDYEFRKIFCRGICEFLLGIDIRYGRKKTSEFVFVSYKSISQIYILHSVV